jgi:hypothetical protein
MWYSASSTSRGAVLALLWICAVAGCAPQVYKAYSGPERPADELALVEPRERTIRTEWLFEELAEPEVRCAVRITKLDGAAVSFKEPKLGVLPGPHGFDVTAHFEDATQIYRSGQPRRISEFRHFVLRAGLEAGHEYRIEGFLTAATPRELLVKIYDAKSPKPVDYTLEELGE